MSEEKKYVTFRDLRSVAPAQKPIPETSTSTSIPSSTSTSSITSISSPEESEVSTSISSSTSTPSISSSPSSTSTPSIARKAEPRARQQESQARRQRLRHVAPESDFQRVPNSVTRRAIPEGLFRGKSKQVWDYLWSITRGAVVPVRSTRKSRREIKAGAGLGSMVTVDAALEHLQNVGLIAVKPEIGSLIGNEYEVFTPEETSTSISSTSSSTRITQNLDILDVLDSSISSTTQTVENTGGWTPPNTSFKTKDINTDDEAFAGFAASMKKAAKEVTGKEPSASEAARWEELAEVLVTELKIAAG